MEMTNSFEYIINIKTLLIIILLITKLIIFIVRKTIRDEGVYKNPTKEANILRGQKHQLGFPNPRIVLSIRPFLFDPIPQYNM